ncbi:MAG TPA: hypothetical protein VNM47_17980 [Terriglobia bacterium]|nr:hypothetical protein [Terriglobia bacterium]
MGNGPKRKRRQARDVALEYNAVDAVTGKSAGPLPLRRPSIITYDGLPLSSGGAHALRTRSPLAALAQVRNFISSCTDCVQPQKASVEVVTGANVPAEFSDPLMERLTADLRAPGNRRSYGRGNTAHFWPVAAPQIDALVELIEQVSPLPAMPYRLQPITVAAVFKFHLLDAHSRAVLPWQGGAFYGNCSAVPGQLLGESQLYARISGRSTVSLFLSFPFEDVSEDLLTTAGFVRTHLPFPLSPNHWKRWRLTKNGKGYAGRRLPPQQIAATT